MNEIRFVTESNVDNDDGGDEMARGGIRQRKKCRGVQSIHHGMLSVCRSVCSAAALS